MPIKIGKNRTKLHCVAVENLNTKVIIGLPGLNDLGLSADFKTREIRMGSRIINTVGEIEREPKGSKNVDVNVDEHLTEQQKDQMLEVIDRWKRKLIEKTKDRGPAVGYKAHLCPTENILA